MEMKCDVFDFSKWLRHTPIHVQLVFYAAATEHSETPLFSNLMHFHGDFFFILFLSKNLNYSLLIIMSINKYVRVIMMIATDSFFLSTFHKFPIKIII